MVEQDQKYQLEAVTPPRIYTEQLYSYTCADLNGQAICVKLVFKRLQTFTRGSMGRDAEMVFAISPGHMNPLSLSALAPLSSVLQEGY